MFIRRGGSAKPSPENSKQSVAHSLPSGWNQPAAPGQKDGMVEKVEGFISRTHLGKSP